MREEGFSASCRSDKKDVGFGQFNFRLLRTAAIDSLVMVVDRYSQSFLCLGLTDDIIIQDFLMSAGFGTFPVGLSTSSFSTSSAMMSLQSWIHSSQI